MFFCTFAPCTLHAMLLTALLKGLFLEGRKPFLNFRFHEKEDIHF